MQTPERDIRKLALNVICSAGFGVQLPFKPAPQATVESADGLFKDAVSPPPGYNFTFRSGNEYTGPHLTSIFLAVSILPKWISKVLQPLLFKTDMNIYHDLGNYLRALISIAEHDERSHFYNLLAGLVRSRREEGDTKETAFRRDPGLSGKEILGNLYIFTIAGHESTASTFGLRLSCLLFIRISRRSFTPKSKLQLITRAQTLRHGIMPNCFQDSSPHCASWRVLFCPRFYKQCGTF